MSDHEKRDSERIELLGSIRGEVMVYQATAVRQIGRGGITVETAFPLQLDSLHDFRLTLGDRSVVLKGRVVHSRVSDVDQDAVVYRSGIEFVDPPRHVVEAVDQFIAAVRQERAAESS